MGRLTWLGGHDTPASDAASARRAKAHRRNLHKSARAAERWEDDDRKRFAAGIFRRRR